MSFELYDWRKHAASVMEDQEVERAFMEQAYTHVSNKAPALMEDPYRLGFEIVHKNDTNNRLVGVFGFRVNKDLLLAPVLFLNGTIKGTELLYQRSTKSFKPLTEEWAKFLLESRATEEGRPFPKKETRKIRNTIQFDRLISPEGIKVASEDREEFDQAVAEMEARCPGGFEKLAAASDLLSTFIVEDGGMRAVGMIGTMVKDSYDFACALTACHPDPDDYMPPALIEKLAKEAAAKPKTTLGLYTGRPTPDTPETARESLYKRGYAIVDERGSDLSAMEVGAEQKLNAVDVAGYYDTLTVGGKIVRAFCAPFLGTGYDFKPVDRMADGQGNACCPSPSIGDEDFPQMETMGITKDKRLVFGRSQIYGDPIDDETALDNEPNGGEKSMTAGNIYVVYDVEKQGFYGPIVCLRKEKGKEGTTVYNISNASCDWANWYTPTEYGTLVIHNPSARVTDPQKGVIGGNVKFFKLKIKKEDGSANASDRTRGEKSMLIDVAAPMPPQDIRDWLQSAGYKPVKLLKQGNTYALRVGHLQTSEFVERIPMAVKLAHDLQLPAAEVDIVMDAARNMPERELDIWIRPNEKAAAAMRIVGSPEFRTRFDSRHGVEVEEPQFFELDGQSDGVSDPGQSVGDAWDPAMGGGGNRDDSDGVPDDILFGGSPEEIAQVAQQQGLPNAFDHGLVGMLVNTYDAVGMIDKYLPKLEEGLDCLGRSLFLLYWKPDDFEKEFGIDDMQEMENKLTSGFQLLGEIVLDFKLKYRDRDARPTGSAPTATL